MKIIKLFLMFLPLLAFGQNKVKKTPNESKSKGKYEYIYAFENGYAVFRTFDHKMGIIDTAHNVIIGPNYSYIYNKRGLLNLFEIGNEIKGKFKRGYIDIKGNIKIPFIYDDVFYFGSGLISVTQNGKHGVIDTSNNIILPIVYDNVSDRNNMLYVQANGTTDLYNFRGTRLTYLNFSNISYFNYNKAIITFPNKATSIIDIKGQIIMESNPNYNFRGILSDSLYLIQCIENSKFGIITSGGKILIKCKYDQIEFKNSVVIAKMDEKKGIITLVDSILKPFIYDDIHWWYLPHSDYSLPDNPINAYIVVINKIHGVISLGRPDYIIPLKYKLIMPIPKNYFLVENFAGDYGIYNTNGTPIIKEEYIFYDRFGGIIFASKFGAPVLISLEDSTFTEIKVDAKEFKSCKDIYNLYDECPTEVFKLNGKYGVLNYKNEILIPCLYESIENIGVSNEFIVKQNNKYGVINTENDIRLPIKYDRYTKGKNLYFYSENNKTKVFYDARFR